jgi:TPR repeat protein
VRPLWKIALPIIACIALVCGTAIAWHVHKAKAHERMLAETARVTLLRAQQGDAKSQFDLGHMYFHGEGVPQNYTEALLWFRKAADQGNAKAQYGIGYMYHNGKGVPQNNAEALRWNLLSAKQGDAKAQNNIGTMYYYGQGVTQDYAEALRWYRLAAEQGNAPAQVDLASMYYHGSGVQQDYTQAFNWYRRAADQGDARAEYDIGHMYSHGQGVPQDYTESLRWFRKADAQGDEYAKRALRFKMGAFEVIDLSVFLLGGLLILSGSQLPKNKIPDSQRRCAAVVGILILFSVGLRLFRYSNIGILLSISTFPAFVFARCLLDGIIVALLLILVELKSLKRVLQISVISFTAFNLFAAVFHSLSRFAAAIRLFTMTNGLLIGMILVLAIFLWRTNPENRERLTRIDDSAAHDPSSATGTESNP